MYSHLACPPHTWAAAQSCGLKCKSVKERLFQDANHHLRASVPAATQVTKDGMILQRILERGSPHQQNPMALQIHTMAPPLSPGTPKKQSGQLLEAR